MELPTLRPVRMRYTRREHPNKLSERIVGKVRWRFAVGSRDEVGYREWLLWVTSRLHGHCVDTSALRAEADVIGGKADLIAAGLAADVRKGTLLRIPAIWARFKLILGVPTKISFHRREPWIFA